MNLLVQILTNRAQRVLKNTDSESNRIFGLAIPSVLTDRVVGSTSSSNFDGTGEAESCLVVVVRTGAEIASMGALDGGSGRRDGPGIEKIEIDLGSSSADQSPG